MQEQFDPEKIGLKISECTYWTVYLSLKQHYLGRMKVVAKRDIVDEGELTDEEWLELHTILQKCKKVLEQCFKPDLYNYATLGNVVLHHHWHIIPRYREPPVFLDVPFPDEQWGHPPWPHTKKKTDTTLLNEIHKIVRETWERQSL